MSDLSAGMPESLQRLPKKKLAESYVLILLQALRLISSQVCQKAYKAKRSLHCHQITNHPELLDSTTNIAGNNDLNSSASSATVSPSTSNLLRETLETRRMARQSGGTDLSTVPDFVKSLIARGMNGHNEEKIAGERMLVRQLIYIGERLSVVHWCI